MFRQSDFSLFVKLWNMCDHPDVRPQFLLHKYRLLMCGIKIESSVKFISELIRSIYVWGTFTKLGNCCDDRCIYDHQSHVVPMQNADLVPIESYPLDSYPLKSCVWNQDLGAVQLASENGIGRNVYKESSVFCYREVGTEGTPHWKTWGLG